MKEIEKYIVTYFGIGGKDLSPVSKLFKQETLSKNDYYLKKNKYCSKLSFVTKGFIRVFSINPNGTKEVTQWLSNEGMFLTELASFHFGTPSRWHFQALTDCELYSISKEDYSKMNSLVKNWDELEKMFLAKCFVSLENRVFEQLSMTAEQRISSMIKTNPEIFLHVPHQYIASMLGMTPETLSRVRKKLSEKP